jgi:hypothetical protein
VTPLCTAFLTAFSIALTDLALAFFFAMMNVLDESSSLRCQYGTPIPSKRACRR